VGYICDAIEVTFREDKWDEYKGDGANLVAYISPRDNYVVNAKEGNGKKVDFLHCIIYAHKLVSWFPTFHLHMGAKILGN
jgi:hypothetical protein